MSPLVPDQCEQCRHQADFDPKTKGLTCAAFPEGIPAPILEDEHDHREPFPGDHGIRFEPTEESRG